MFMDESRASVLDVHVLDVGALSDPREIFADGFESGDLSGWER